MEESTLRITVLDWVFAHRSTLVPFVLALDAAAWTALIFFGWHYFNCGM
ncbi:MAG: hypothetical protein QGH77_01795 [Planctomycetota bacterium]|jgi:hypothetical protein|nr:hypothetical protein [Planctomycetota bacterium]|tara:strand:- start:219 stop:365 length:147 start_codon:yes stop_codon:yes gene_type:complete